MRNFWFFGLFLSVAACANKGVNDPAELREIAGNYFGEIKLNEDMSMEMQLQLKPSGFYLITHEDLKGEGMLIRENGVFIYKNQEIELARKQNGFRYFRYENGKIFVYNLYHRPYTNFTDSSFYLKPR